MSEDDLTVSVDQNLQPSHSRRVRDAVADAFAFIRSAEVNQAVATVTLEQLMGDQIIRNGETSRSNAAQYDPYTYDPKASEEASKEALPRANFLGGVDTNRPTKLDRLLAIVNNIEKVVEEIKALDPVEVASTEEYVDMGPIAAPEDEE